MADKRGLQHPQGLACPLCLDTFKNPTLLLCGHTFCKVCLEGYDQQRNGVDHMECPVCRKRTKLEENRVAGLSPNFSLKGLQDELHIDEQTSQNLCPIHKAKYRNIFCEVCENFICITCFIKNHQGHRIIRKTDLKEGLRKKKMALIQDGKARKSQIEKILKDAEQQMKEICCHLSKMEKEIRDAYAKKVTTLQENERKLIEKVHSIQRDSDKQLNSCIAHHNELIDNISISVVILERDKSEHLQDHVLIEDHLRCISLENSLKKVSKPNDEQSMAQVLQAAKNSKFHCAKRKLLDVGHIEPGGNATSNSQQVKATTSNGQQAKATTSNSQQAKATTSYSQQAKAKTSNSQQARATTSSSQQAKATTSNSQQAKATTSNSQQGKATTSNSQQGKATTSNSQQANATTSNSQQTKSTTSNSQQTKATTSNSQQAKATTSNSQQVKATTSNSQQAKAITSSSQQAKATTSSSQQAKATTSSSQQAKATTSSSQQAKATTSSSQQAKAITSNSQQAKATTSSSQQAKATTSSSQQAKATLSNSQQAKAITSNSQQAKATTSNSQQGKATVSYSQQAKATTSNSQQAKATTSSSQQGKATASYSQQAKATSSSQQAKATTSSSQQVKASTSSSQQAKTTAPVAVHTLGHNGQGGKASTGNSQHVITTAQVNMNTDEMQPSTSGNVGAIPAMVKNNSLTIVKEAELHGMHVYGMAARSQDSVVIGYGVDGSERLSLSGESTRCEEEVCDIACLTHGRSAVSRFGGVCRIYNAHGIQDIQFQYQCKQSCGFGYYTGTKLCSDQHDNIYAVNGNPEIYIFSGSNPNPQTIIPTGKVENKQICVTNTGAIIISGNVYSSNVYRKAVHILRSVTVYDREGRVGSSIKSNNMMVEYLYAAVDSRDRVLVARVKRKCNVLRLSRYTLQGVTLTKEVMFKQLRLPHKCTFLPDDCCMVSLTPSMIAFYNGNHLFFIELGL